MFCSWCCPLPHCSLSGWHFCYLRKLRSMLERLGCLSFRSALASICRIRSRVTENCWPTCCQMLNETGREPTPDELAEELRMPVAKVRLGLGLDGNWPLLDFD